MHELPLIQASDPTVAYSSDGIWSVTWDGGPHCPGNLTSNLARAIFGNDLACCLPPDHDGDCIPAAAELLDEGARLHPVATPVPAC